MQRLDIENILRVHEEVIRSSGGSQGVRDRPPLESALAQPFQSFGGEDLYPGIVAIGAALAYFIIQNHPFVDGNKRTGHAALEIFLNMNGYEIVADENEQELIILGVASSEINQNQFREWLAGSILPLDPQFSIN